jgi:hypothetical protein
LFVELVAARLPVGPVARQGAVVADEELAQAAAPADAL